LKKTGLRLIISGADILMPACLARDAPHCSLVNPSSVKEPYLAVSYTSEIPKRLGRKLLYESGISGSKALEAFGWVELGRMS
jgi:hypothetical protein